MIDFKDLQRKVYQNKVDKNFNITDVYLEFCLLQEEASEAFRAFLEKREDLGEELADVAIYLMGIAEINGINLEKEIQNKIQKNSKRKYEKINGILRKVN